mmetsp:Transcript_10789/g.26916  ORF Transcript_10789/g.26916 Transcript_10789/m.26916 type:complete len:235 (-) Transcript_10789:7-711(-)
MGPAQTKRLLTAKLPSIATPKAAANQQPNANLPGESSTKFWKRRTAHGRVPRCGEKTEVKPVMYIDVASPLQKARRLVNIWWLSSSFSMPPPSPPMSPMLPLPPPELLPKSPPLLRATSEAQSLWGSTWPRPAPVSPSASVVPPPRSDAAIAVVAAAAACDVAGGAGGAVAVAKRPTKRHTAKGAGGPPRCDVRVHRAEGRDDGPDNSALIARACGDERSLQDCSRAGIALPKR